MEVITKEQLLVLRENILDTITGLKIEDKRNTLKQLELDSAQQNFWNDQDRAKTTLIRIEQLRKEISTANELINSINTIIDIYSPNDSESIRDEVEKVEKNYLDFQILKFLSGKYDNSTAILSIHAGQGGTEACDWAMMLYRMYNRWAEKNGYTIEVIDTVEGTETGISSATIKISGPYAFGKLKHEAGTHRLVRLSPFNAQNLRQTSFAGIEVIPEIDETEDIDVKDEDIEFKAVRAGGAGGQYVNKTSSAVQIKHIPTGIVVHSSCRRDQLQNRKEAMNILKSKLWRIEEEKRENEIKGIKGEHKIASWGNQIRNYVLHPYKLVKDLRTKVEIHDPESVLDGDLNQLIDAEIRIG